MTDEELMSLLREVPPPQFDAPTRRTLQEVQRSGTHVTVFEVIATHAILMVAHVAPRPSIEAIRRAYEMQRDRV